MYAVKTASKLSRLSILSADKIRQILYLDFTKTKHQLHSPSRRFIVVPQFEAEAVVYPSERV